MYGYIEITSFIFYKKSLNKGLGKLYYKAFYIDLLSSSAQFCHVHKAPED